MRKQVNGNNYSQGTLVNYSNLLYTLCKFEKYIGIELTWEMINRTLYSSFVKWHEDQGHSKNYIGKHIKDLKCLMRNGYELWLQSRLL